MNDFYRLAGDRLLLDIKAIPGTSKTEIAGSAEGRLCIRIAAAPEDGRANAGLRDFLAKALGCAKKEVIFVSGEKSRLKTVSLPAAALDLLLKKVGL